MKSAFCLQAVTKRYPAREKAPGFALGPLNLSLPGGCILGLIGGKRRRKDHHAENDAGAHPEKRRAHRTAGPPGGG